MPKQDDFLKHSIIPTNVSVGRYDTFLSLVNVNGKLVIHITDRLEYVPENPIATTCIGKLDDKIIEELKKLHSITTVLEMKGM